MAYSNFYARFYSFGQEAAAALKAVWNFTASRFYFLAVGLLQLVGWWQVFYIYRHLSGNLLVLHYNVDFGIDLVGPPTDIFIYPIFGLGVFILNLLVAASLHRRRDFHIFVHFLLAAAVVFGGCLALALFFIYMINFK